MAVEPDLAAAAPESARRQLGHVLASQALASGGNFLAALLAARVSDSAEFGRVSLFIAFYVISVQLVRPFTGNVLQVTAAEEGRETSARLLGTLAISSPGRSCSVSPSCRSPSRCSTATTSPGSSPRWPRCHCSPSTTRFACGAWPPSNLGAPSCSTASGSGCSWSPSRPSSFIGDLSGAEVIFLWAVAGATVAAGQCTAWVLAQRPGLDLAGAWADATRIGRVYLAEAVLAAASSSGFILLLALVVEVDDIGRLRLLEMPFGVAVAIGQGLALFLLPEARRVLVAGQIDRAWRVSSPPREGSACLRWLCRSRSCSSPTPSCGTSSAPRSS